MLSKYKYEDVFTSSQSYANRFSGKTGAWLLSVQEEALLEVLYGEVAEGQKMLDVGGAHGQLIEIASRLNLDLTIVASHEDALTNLKERIPDTVIGQTECEEYEAVVSDLLELPFPERSFAVVSSVRLISHCDDWKKLVTEMCRVSNDLVILDYPPLASTNIFYKLFFPIKKLLEGNTRTYEIFSHEQIEQEFMKNDFYLQQRIGQFFWPMVIHRKLNSPRLSGMLEKLAQLLGLVAMFGNPVIASFCRQKEELIQISLARK